MGSDFEESCIAFPHFQLLHDGQLSEGGVLIL